MSVKTDHVFPYSSSHHSEKYIIDAILHSRFYVPDLIKNMSWIVEYIDLFFVGAIIFMLSSTIVEVLAWMSYHTR